MPIVQLNFPNPLNVSVQIGDVAYFANPVNWGTTGNILDPGNQWAGTSTPPATASQSDIIIIGEIIAIQQWNGTVSWIQCNMDQDIYNLYYASIQPAIPGPPSFIMFSKDNKVNLNSMVGYYASVEFRNNSISDGELFNVGTRFFESSK